MTALMTPAAASLPAAVSGPSVAPASATATPAAAPDATPTAKPGAKPRATPPSLAASDPARPAPGPAAAPASPTPPTLAATTGPAASTLAGDASAANLQAAAAAAAVAAAGLPSPTDIGTPASVHHADLSAHPTEPAFADELATQVRFMAEGDVQQAELRLNPQELGPIRIQLALDGDRAEIRLDAALALTREGIERALAETIHFCLCGLVSTPRGGAVVVVPREAFARSAPSGVALIARTG